MSENQNIESPTPAKRKRGKGRLILTIVVLLVAAVLLLVALLPTMISAGVGRGTVMGMVNDSIRGTITVDSLSVGWFSGAQIEGLTLVDEQGQPVLTAQSIDAPDAGLLGLIMGSTDLGTITITKSNATLVQDEEGVVNIQRATESPDPQPDAPSEGGSNYNLKLVVVDGEGSFAGPNIPTAFARNIESTIDLTGMSSMKMTLATSVEQQGQTGSPGEVSIDAAIDQMSDASGAFNLNNAIFDVTASIQKLPTSVIDVAAGQDGQLVAMLGPMLDANLKAKGSLSDLSADLQAKAERLDASVVVSSTDSALVVAPDSRIVITVTPEAWQRMTANNQGEGAEPGAELTSPFDISLLIAELNVPKSGSQLKWDAAAVRTQFVVGNIELRTPGPIAQMTLADTQANVTLESSQLKLDARSVGIQGQNRGQFSLDGTITGLVTENGDLRLMQENDQPLMSYLAGQIAGSIEQFPIAVVDQIIDQDNLGQRLLGDTLDGRLVWNLGGEATGDAAGGIPAGTFELTAASPKMPSLTARMTQKGETADLNWKVEMQGVDVASLAGSSNVEPIVSEVVGRGVNGVMEGSGTLDWARYEAAGALAALNADFTLDVTGGNSQKLNATGAIRHESIGIKAEAAFPDLNIARVMLVSSEQPEADAQTTSTDSTIQLLGERLAVQFNADLTIATTAGQLPEPATSGMSGTLALTAKNQQTDVNVKGVVEKGVATLNDSKISVTLTPAYVESMMASDEPTSANEPATLALVEPTPLVVTIDELQVDLAAEKTGPMPIAATVTSPQMILMTSSAPQPVTLQGLVITVPKTDMKSAFPVSGKTQLAYLGKPAGNVTLDATAAETNGEYVIQTADLVWSNPSAELIDAVSSGGGKLAAILQGGIDELKVKVKGDPRKEATFLATSTGSALKASLPGRLTENLMSVENGSVTLTITPEAYTRYQTIPAADGSAPAEPASWQLGNAANVTLDIARFASPRGEAPAPAATPAPAAPTPPPGAISAAPAPAAPAPAAPAPAATPANGGTLAATLKSDAVQFRQAASNQAVAISNMRIDLTSENISDQANAVGGLDVVLTPAGGQAINGKLTLNAVASGLSSDTGRNINATIKGDQVPTAMLDALAGQDNLFVDAIGPVMNLSVVAQQQGEQPGVATIDLKGDNATINVPGQLQPDGSITLAENATATFNVTPQLGQSLARLNPVLLQVQSGQKPVEMTISKGAVLYAPNEDPTASAIQNLSMTTALNLNDLQLTQGGLLGTITNLLKIGSKDLYAVSFKPMSFQMKDGVLSYIDPLMMDFGTGVNLGFDGNVNLVNKKLGLNMLVPPALLQKLLNKDDDFATLVVPLGGTYDKPMLDPGKFAQALVKQAGKTVIDDTLGEGGKAVGGIIEGVFGGNKKQESSGETTPQQNGNQDSSTDSGTQQQETETKPKEKDVLGGILQGVLQRKKDKDAE